MVQGARWRSGRRRLCSAWEADTLPTELLPLGAERVIADRASSEVGRALARSSATLAALRRTRACPVNRRRRSETASLVGTPAPAPSPARSPSSGIGLVAERSPTRADAKQGPLILDLSTA